MALRPPLKNRVVRGVVFVDGTLTVPFIDFAKMRRVVGVPQGQDILDFLASLPPEERAIREMALHAVEEEGMAAMQVQPGADELAAHLDERGVPRALVTRNLKRAVDLFHEEHFQLPPFLPVLTREFLPYKPDPAALKHIAEHWGVRCEELVMVGDSAKDDIVSGTRAGAWTILLDTEATHADGGARLQGEMRPHFYARSLAQVRQVLESELELRAPVSEPEPE